MVVGCQSSLFISRPSYAPLRATKQANSGLWFTCRVWRTTLKTVCCATDAPHSLAASLAMHCLPFVLLIVFHCGEVLTNSAALFAYHRQSCIVIMCHTRYSVITRTLNNAFTEHSEFVTTFPCCITYSAFLIIRILDCLSLRGAAHKLWHANCRPVPAL